MKDGNKFRIPNEKLRLFASAEFEASKASNTRRIFCVGGSTTQGEPFQPPTAFPAWLQINLQLLKPNENWDVINCGGLSYASYRMLPIVEEILKYSADLVIVECGHNEFLEARELDGWQEATPFINPLFKLAECSRLIQFAQRALHAKSSNISNETRKTRLSNEVIALLDYQGGLQKYRRDSLNHDAVVKSMQWNLHAIVRACEEAKVPLVFLVPTCNLRDCPPFKTDLLQSLDPKIQQRITFHWTQAKALRESSLEGKAEVRVATEMQIVDELHELLKIDPDHADANYWLGIIELDRRNFLEAQKNLIHARDCDVCPLRSTNMIQRSIRKIADETKVWMFDVDELFQSVSDQAIVGDRWLVDHVHPRIEGHQLLGERLAEFLVNQAWVTPSEERWKEYRQAVYKNHLAKFGEEYFLRGKQRLEGLIMWTQGRARKGLARTEAEP